jgi:small nuclear ribonucleoprotein (snRNP)-like protein
MGQLIAYDKYFNLVRQLTRVIVTAADHYLTVVAKRHRGVHAPIETT